MPNIYRTALQVSPERIAALEDTSDSNKVLEKRGPHTATIKCKDARVYGNVPKKLG